MESGTRLGAYEILEPLGKGGMGEVYRARDTRLGRDVAIKVLPAELADDPQRLARLEREARLLASLNHPNIGSIYGLEEFGGGPGETLRPALVLELVEGPTLVQRIDAGPLPVVEALGIALQIAEALEDAHERGVVHRDLKPDNVKVGDDGTVKVLDFGLAKALEEERTEEAPSDSPTVSAMATQAGMILGTAGYMSPEQAKGKAVDRRADVWAFGVVLREMLTGEATFQGETASETLAAVIKDDPGLERLPPETPVRVRDLLQRCLVKDPRRRLQAIGEARIALEAALAEPGASTLATAGERGLDGSRAHATATGWRRAMPWAVALVTLIVGWTLGGIPTRPGENPTVALEFDLGPEEPLLVAVGSSVELSPDGTRMAIVTGFPPDSALHLRALDRLESTRFPRTEGAMHPFFSPDGQWIGFFDRGALKKISVTGGAPITLCEVEPQSRGGSWGEDDTIVFAPAVTGGLARVPASGGEPESITTPVPEREGNSHRWPQFLPGGKAILFIGGSSGAFADASIMALSLETGEVHTVHRGGMYARYVPTGHLLYVHEGTLYAAPFDLDRLELTGPSRPVVDGIVAAPTNAGAQYSVAGNGTLVYAAGVQAIFTNTMHWVGRDGELSAPIGGQDIYGTPAISPDGDRLAVSLGVPVEADIWVRDLARATMTRLTFDGAGNLFPVWSPDGRWLAYGSVDGEGVYRIWARRADGAGGRVRLSAGEISLSPRDWTPDGRTLVAVEAGSGDLHLLDLPEGLFDGTSVDPVETEPFLASEFGETFASFSPDGRWIAYESDESGGHEIYVRPYPGPGGKWQVSTDGGRFAVWSPDGGEIYYLDDNRIMAVASSSTEETFSVGPPRIVVELPMSPINSVILPLTAGFDLAPDGDRFLVLQSEEVDRQEYSARPTIVLNWLDELERRVPTGR